MAKECLIIGQPNVGKTLFLVNFAEYLGNDVLRLVVYYPEKKLSKIYSSEEARDFLVSDTPHSTLWQQSIDVVIPVGKGKKKVTITDTGGLSEGIHSDLEVRKAMANTIAKIRTTKLIIHLMDASALGKNGSITGMSEIDYQIVQFARATKGYMILANKIDLCDSDLGCRILRDELSGVPIIPISALHKFGFEEVRGNVAKFL